ncbi:4Fe-4S dicluster domain-containing protein [Metallumcola ferriviriculae]|uniref:4Fe-4S dicluster domain-containing protein n=1 Tax=Metallumcola ferriviriculae TaxID=3039180 RepID=A0AAU0UTF8_9FIRM|nr:4Fe-4S dicluster domain-containing protein [Desulfitibacteraceae bacterium MK1]
MGNKLVTDFSICTGCAICLLACSNAAVGGFNPRLARMKVLNERDGLVSRPVVCNQCKNAFCQQVCPTGAIKRNEQGVLVVNEQDCNGCGSCSEYCPNGVIVILKKKALKCDLCGGSPRCVEQCPTGALQLFNGGDCCE